MLSSPDLRFLPSLLYFSPFLSSDHGNPHLCPNILSLHLLLLKLSSGRCLTACVFIVASRAGMHILTQPIGVALKQEGPQAIMSIY